ncbi:tRNA pseudouridine synthase B [Archaeoglobus sulfaticallidus PM70-1]|uniref:Probable tRNA pseudouridine synthase B n=1 Tax=Archaeoglobus sulfaticallidus PM70-1 TaxID=387631 RepID=N0BAW4_9EURY|nr:tRNA pseudouridine synthase B [Archaeoglobus sulfaticallidus PM70-1]
MRGMGAIPTKDPIQDYIRNGVVCIDKPSGPTSHEVVVWVRKILEVSRTGHAGTLDPKVTGVLPVFIENATKLVRFLQTSGKEYVALMRLHGDASEKRIREAFNLFKGKIYQRPPLKSAVKKVLRIREIYESEILEVDGRDVLFRVRTEAGTYIRKLCTDIGEVIGTGAHMQELRRTKTGLFDENSAFTLHDLLDAYVIYKETGEERYLREIIKPMEIAVKDMKKVVVKDTAVSAICYGADLSARGICYIEKGIKAGDDVAIFTLKNEVVAIGKALADSERMLNAKSGIMVETERVIMDRDMYPRFWKSKSQG